MFYVSHPKQNKLEVKRTKKKFIINKRNPRKDTIDEQKNRNQYVSSSIWTDEYTEIFNNATLFSIIEDLNLKNFEKNEIRRKIQEKYADISIEDIIRILNEGKGQGKGNHKYRPIIPNQNGRMRPNTETYHEIF